MTARKYLFVTFNLILLMIFAIVAGAIGIYTYAWDDNYAHGFTKLVPVPAAIVGNRLVTIAEYDARLGSFEKASSRAASVEEKHNILNDLVSEKVIQDLADSKGIRVKRQDVDKYYSYTLSSLNINSVEARQEIEKNFGWSEEQFRQYLIVPAVYEHLLRADFFRSQQNAPAFKKANDLEKLFDSTTTADFTVLARVYSEDEESKYLGGDIGFLTLQELDPALSGAIENLEEGKVSGMIVSGIGYHFLKVASIDEESNPRRYQVKQILIKGQDFEKYLENQKSEHRVYRLMRP